VRREKERGKKKGSFQCRSTIDLEKKKKLVSRKTQPLLSSSSLNLRPPPPLQVTCGSALKLEHAETGRLLHSQNIGKEG